MTAEEHHDDSTRKSETYNTCVLAAHQVLIRVAWVFKTESVIMPAFVDLIAGAGWLRGCLPVLNRLGNSLPPLLVAAPLKNTRRKKWMLMASSVAMAIPFLVLAAIWFAIDHKRQPWLPITFLTLYLLFFSAVGINQLSFSTVQGKLLRAEKRGRLMSLAGFVGTVFSVIGLLFFLTDWLERDDGGFGLIFGFTGVGFLFGALSVALIRESPDEMEIGGDLDPAPLLDAWRVFRTDSNFRHLVTVAVCFSPLILLFPHYQTLGRGGASIQSSASDLMVWVVTQNIAVGIYSMIAGTLADRYGNRLVLRCQLFISALTPIVALGLARSNDDHEANYFWITFAFLGIAPVTLRTFSNYCLELTQAIHHPRYVSTLSVCGAIPFLASPLVGYFVDFVGFPLVFTACSLIIAAGFWMTLRMPEPRKWNSEARN